MLNSKSLIKLSAGLLLLSAVAAPKAHAQSVDVPFNGNSPNACSFTVPTAGVLAISGPRAAMEGGTGVTGFGSGTAGKVSVTCTGGGTLTTAVPAPVAVPAGFTPVVVQAVVQRGANTAAADFTSANTGGTYDNSGWLKNTTPLALPVGVSDLNVAMITGARTLGAVPSGTYTYNVKLTVVSN